MDGVGPAGPWRVHAATPEETARLGALAGAAARAGDAFLLEGPVGAGKTVLAGGILRGLGVPGPHPSPTFTLVRLHRGRYPVAHLDLYRLGPGAAEEELGWEDLLDPGAVLVVEWAEFLGARAPTDGVRVRLEMAVDGRWLSWTPLGAAGARLLAAVRAPVHGEQGRAGGVGR
jgi:tRNA threonylcarbamoyladenosine biosynthesis protein TsaE